MGMREKLANNKADLLYGNERAVYMQELVSVILDYIARERTSYAIFINGKWGTGKTYFWNNVLKVAITDKEPLYISLNGLSNVESIPEKLFYVAHNVNSAKDLVKVIKTVIEKYTGFSIKIPYDRLIDYSKYVVCFDDLERVNVDIKEVFGYISSIVESRGAKVIIIGYDEELENHMISHNIEAKIAAATHTLKSNEKFDKEILTARMKELFDDYSVFKRIKEKLIGKTIEFIPEYKQIIENIIRDYRDKKYADFLNDNIDLILDTFVTSETQNLRILRYSLDDFRQVFSHIEADHCSIQVELSKKILVFHLASAFEIMTGKYTKQDFKSYTSNSYYLLQLSDEEEATMLKENGQKIKPKSLVPFLQKYFPATYNQYPFFPSIWRMIFEGNFNTNEFNNEVAPLYPIQKDQDIVSIFVDSYWEMTDEKFSESVTTILAMIEKGNASFSCYLRVFYIFESLVSSNSIPISVDELKNKFKIGLDLIALRDEPPVQNFDNNFELFESKFSGDYKEIKSYVYAVNETLERKAVQTTVSELADLLSTDVEAFCRRISSSKGEDSRLKIFNHINLDKVISFIRNAPSGELIEFRNALGNRYGFTNIRDYYFEELPSLRAMEDAVRLIAKEYDDQQGVISHRPHATKVLLKTIKSIADRLEQKSDC
jgi:DNA-binding ferritin-like protein (Dps family)